MKMIVFEQFSLSHVWMTMIKVVFEQLSLSHAWMTMIEVVFEQLSLSHVWMTMIEVCVLTTSSLCLNDDDRSCVWTTFIKSCFFLLLFCFFFWSCLNDDDKSCVWTTLGLVNFGGCVLTTLMVMTMLVVQLCMNSLWLEILMTKILGTSPKNSSWVLHVFLLINNSWIIIDKYAWIMLSCIIDLWMTKVITDVHSEMKIGQLEI